MPAAVPTAVLKTPQAVKYVGGERIFNGLREHHSAILKPFSQTSNGSRSYLVADLDAALLVAREAGTFVCKVDKDPSRYLAGKA